jgi:hypothetical protein
MADHPIRLRRSLARTRAHRLLESHAPGIEIALEGLPDDALTEREERVAGADRRLGVKAPDWFTDMLKRGASPEEVLGMLRDRITQIRDLVKRRASSTRSGGCLPGVVCFAAW